MLETGYMESPVGLLEIVIKEGAVTEIHNDASLRHVRGVKDGTRQESPCPAFSTAEQGESNGESPLLAQVKKQLREYFAGKRRTFDFPIQPAGTGFQKEVWKVMQQIPFGQTMSYSQVAQQIGRPNACRAVGNAVGMNPVLIAIPCHRVIGSGGNLGGFSAGLENKVLLHELEGIQCKHFK